MTEYQRARAWREGLGLSRYALSDITGYSESAIQYFEAGKNLSSGKAINTRDMLAYRLACAAVAARIKFDWGPVSIELP